MSPRLFTFLILVLWLSGCASTSAPSPTLYERLGSEQGIHAIVNRFLLNVADDQRIVGYFAHTNIDHLAVSLEQYICDLSDGPCVYVGPSMARTHQHMGLNDAAFNALVENLRQALVEEEVSTGARNALLGRLAPQYADIMRDQ